MQVESHILDRPDRHQGCPAPSSSTNIWAMSKSSTTRVWREMWPLSRRISRHSQTSPLPGSSRFDLRYPPLFRVAGVDCWFQSYGKGGGYQQRKSHGRWTDHRKNYQFVQRAEMYSNCSLIAPRDRGCQSLRNGREANE